MAKTHKHGDVASRRRARSATQGEAQREVFADAYDIAMQIVALREDPGLTRVSWLEGSGEGRPG